MSKLRLLKHNAKVQKRSPKRSVGCEIDHTPKARLAKNNVQCFTLVSTFPHPGLKMLNAAAGEVE